MRLKWWRVIVFSLMQKPEQSMRGSVLAPPKTMTEELFTLSVCAREGGGEGARERWGDSHEVPLIMVVGELEEVARPVNIMN